jgi:hypothetical protein
MRCGQPKIEPWHQIAKVRTALRLYTQCNETDEIETALHDLGQIIPTSQPTVPCMGQHPVAANRVAMCETSCTPGRHKLHQLLHSYRLTGHECRALELLATLRLSTLKQQEFRKLSAICMEHAAWSFTTAAAPTDSSASWRHRPGWRPASKHTYSLLS